MQILIVADSEAVGRWLLLVLQARGHQVTWQRDGAGGCDHLRDNEVDVVVAESILGDGSHDDWVRAFRAARKNARVLLVFPPTSDGVPPHVAEDALVRPFSRETLLATIARLGEIEAGASSTSLAASSPAPPEPLGGGLAETLIELARRGATGVLNVASDTVRRRITIRGGAPTNLSGDYSADNFGRFLVRREVIDDATLESSHQLMVSKGLAQGEALVELGVVNSSKLYDLLREFQYEKLLSMFGWDAPEIAFDSAAAIPPGEAVYDMEPSQVVFEGSLRYGPVSPLYVWLDANADRHLVRTRRFHELCGPLQTLSPRLPLQQLTAGDKPLGQLLKAVPIDAVLALRALRALELLGMLRLTDKPAPADDVAAPAPEPVVGEYGLAASAEGEADPELTADEAIALDEIFGAYLSLQFRDHYALLGVKRNAGNSEIEQAYLRAQASFERALRLHSRHPSAHAKAEEVLVHLGFARSVLTQPQTRAAYDSQLEQKDSLRLERRISLGAETRFKSGLNLLRSGRHLQARIEFEAARALRPNDALCSLYACWAQYLELQESARQIRELREAIVDCARVLGDAEGFAFGAQVCSDLGCRELALQLAQQSLQLDGQCALARALVDAHQETG
ncbi:MAG: hypothetical protein JXR83_10950 [Deltaproteobacteria bacterium]|nr:hypothetical protein [Deltaproteobacteria bacterium]